MNLKNVHKTFAVLAGLTAIALMTFTPVCLPAGAAPGLHSPPPGKPTNAKSRYQVTGLGTLRGLANSYVWGGVNSRGHVAAYASNDEDPGNSFFGAKCFLWKGPGDIQLLPGLPGSDMTGPFSLNDLDQVVGASGPTPDGHYLPVLWDHGHVHALPTLPGYGDGNATFINNSGVVVGNSQTWDGDAYTSRAVVWYEGDIFPLPALRGADISTALAVNDGGQIVGESNSRAVLWTLSPRPRVRDLGTLGGEAATAWAINNHGQIAGTAQNDSGDWLPVAWDGRGIHDLELFGDDLVGTAFDNNNDGQIVGYSAIDAGDMTTMHAVLWENGRVISLQDQLPANSGWVLQQATGINDQGQITGCGIHRGKIRAFLLTPR